MNDLLILLLGFAFGLPIGALILALLAIRCAKIEDDWDA
jgi:hypothetical protein